MPVLAKLVELLKLPSPVRWNVLFVEPCSPGHVPVPSVAHPTPVFGGKPCKSPLRPVTALFIRSFIVGIAPSAAYLSTRSGRMPSAAKRTAFSADGFPDAACAFTAVKMGTATDAAKHTPRIDRDQILPRRFMGDPLVAIRLPARLTLANSGVLEQTHRDLPKCELWNSEQTRKYGTVTDAYNTRSEAVSPSRGAETGARPCATLEPLGTLPTARSTMTVCPV